MQTTAAVRTLAALDGDPCAGLEGVRQDRQWLLKFITDPKAVIDSGDPVAKQLVKDAGGIIVQQMTDECGPMRPVNQF